VVVSSRKLDACEAVVKEIQAEGGTAMAISASIAIKSQLEEMVQKTRDAWGSIDVLVCNAASNPYYGPMSGMNDEQFTKILQNNIVSNHWLIQMVAPEMIARKNGSIIIISSIGGLRGSPVLGAYCVSKAADMQLARNYAVEYGRHNIRTNCIAPGSILSEGTKQLFYGETGQFNDRVQAMLAHVPLGRPGQPEEIAHAVLFLAAPESSYLNGAIIPVDGGRSAAG
jgi:NAD(P)-dependent dehydrogenase (short-subunit alcohol dehydrogenase family)